VSPTWQSKETLEPKECLRLLSSTRLGRIGLCTPTGPQVLPVNHSLLDGAIVFRTDLYSVISQHTEEGTVAFETDELDDLMSSGWSVHVTGRAEHVEGSDEMGDLFRRMGEPWAPGQRPVLVRIHPAEVTGRRFHRES
jgi:nitroimidazol reductase NimA-like FMN-containing flavoprotein (pyridoxamine 5'-phosphate oxidase superfamily)